MTDYKQYNSTVKSVTVACEQSAGGYHLEEGDLRALKYAIDDLISLYNTRATPELVLTNTEANTQPYWNN